MTKNISEKDNQAKLPGIGCNLMLTETLKRIKKRLKKREKEKKELQK